MQKEPLVHIPASCMMTVGRDRVRERVAQDEQNRGARDDGGVEWSDHERCIGTCLTRRPGLCSACTMDEETEHMNIESGAAVDTVM